MADVNNEADKTPSQQPQDNDSSAGAKTGKAKTGRAINGRPVMDVKVYAPFKIYFEGSAYSVSAVNEVGPFDILPQHRNFLSMLVPCDLVVHSPEREKTVRISRALMHVKSDRVVVFMDV